MTESTTHALDRIFGHQICTSRYENGSYTLAADPRPETHLWIKVPNVLPVNPTTSERFIPGYFRPLDDRDLYKALSRRKQGAGKLMTITAGVGRFQGFTYKKEDGFVFTPCLPDDSEGNARLVLRIEYDRPAVQSRVSPQQIFGNRNVLRVIRVPASSNCRYPLDLIVLRLNDDTLPYAQPLIDADQQQAAAPRERFYRTSDQSAVRLA